MVGGDFKGKEKPIKVLLERYKHLTELRRVIEKRKSDDALIT